MQAVQWLNQRGTRTTDAGVHLTGRESRTLTGGQVDQYLAARITNTFNHFAKQGRVAGAHTGYRVAHMDMNNCGPRFCGVDAVVCDMFRGNRVVRMLGLVIVTTADRTGQNDFVGH